MSGEIFNANMQVKEGKLTIEIDLTQEKGLSGSGKNIIVSSTGGNTKVPGSEDMQIGLNVFKKP